MHGASHLVELETCTPKPEGWQGSRTWACGLEVHKRSQACGGRAGVRAVRGGSSYLPCTHIHIRKRPHCRLRMQESAPTTFSSKHSICECVAHDDRCGDEPELTTTWTEDAAIIVQTGGCSQCSWVPANVGRCCLKTIANTAVQLTESKNTHAHASPDTTHQPATANATPGEVYCSV